MSVYRRLLPFIRPHAGRLTGAMGANVLAALCDAFSMALLIPFLNVLFDQPPLDIQSETIRTILNVVLQHFDLAEGRMAALRSVILVVILVIILKNILIWIGGQLGASLQEYVTRDLRNAVYRHLAHLPLGYFTRTKAGQIISRVINDTFEARLVLTQIVTQAFQAFSMVLASIVFLVAISPQLTLLALVVAPILMVILQPLLKKLRRGNRRRGVQHGEMTSVLQETIGGARLIKSFGTETFEEQRFATASNTYARSSFRLTRLALLAGPLSEVVIMGIAMVLLWVGARQVLVSQEMSGADLLAFLMYILRMMSPLKQLLGIPATAQSSLASAERLFDILDTPAENQTDKGTRTVTQFERDIVFDDVSFAYELPPATAQYPVASSMTQLTNTLPVLHNVSFTAKRGELIALVGASGAGKTTLVDLIPRFYEPTSGTILLDGVDTQTVTLSSLRSLMGIVSQDTVLFHDSVRNNIAYGQVDKYTDAQIEAAARAANAHEFIVSLPKGYNTTLGDRGARLSGGQRQRLAIARALLSDPPILILDEATSALDTESEQLVQAAVDRLLEGRTVFVIAHRLSTVRNATQILVLDQGRIVERGTHAELLATGGVYARLHALQFSGDNTSAPQPAGDQEAALPSPSSLV